MKKKSVRKTMVFSICAVCICALVMVHAAKQEEGGQNVIMQMPELPNGCEAASLAMLLNDSGVAADKVELFEEYFPRGAISVDGGRIFGPDPEEAYGGDAASADGGWYCFEGPVAEAGTAYLQEHGYPLQVVTMTGISQDELDAFLAEGHTAAVWVTLSFAEPARSSLEWVCSDGYSLHPYTNLHCVVAAGKEDESYRILDPLEGEYLVEEDVFWHVFTAMGSRCAAVEAL